MNIARAKETSREFMALYESDAQTKELVDMAQKLEGIARHASTHAAGVVITREPADSYVPLQKTDASIVTQFPMNTLEELGLLKMDFLGLRTLTVIDDAVKMIRVKAKDFTIESIPLDDHSVFEMLGRGHTNGVFQFESAGMKNVLMQLKAEHMEDIIAVISLYRPGPMESIPRYVRCRHEPESVTYKTPLLKPILEVTYGCIVYQEQVMQIFRELAGYSYGRADLVRRAMSKKKHDVMQRERKDFIAGCVKNGVPESVANELFDEMASFASYAFNKSHAAAYALVAYQTAYLKAHHPHEFMAALLTSVLDFTEKVIDYIAESKRLGIEVMPPDVNESGAGFGVVGDKIRFGLMAVKNLGRGFISGLISERENGPFKSLPDFLSRMAGKELNRRVIENLIKCGAFDCFGRRRSQMMAGYEKLLEDAEATHRSNLSGQMNLFGKQDDAGREYMLPDVEEYPLMKRLSDEKETTGLYISGHPLSEFDTLAKRLKTTDIAWLHANGGDGARAEIFGIVTGKKLKTTKSNEMMAFVEIEDKSAAIEVIVFPKTFMNCSHRLNIGNVLHVKGRVKTAEEDSAQMVAEELFSPEEAAPSERPKEKRKNSRDGLYLKFTGICDNRIDSVVNLLKVFEGSTPVYFYYKDSGKYVRTPNSYWVSKNDVMLRELRRILGQNAVAVIE